MITFSCPACGKVFQVKDEDGGRTGRCTCGQPMQVPPPMARPVVSVPTPNKPPPQSDKPTTTVSQNPPQATASPASPSVKKSPAPTPASVKPAPITAASKSPPKNEIIDETADLNLAPEDVPPSLPEPIDDLVLPTASMLPPRPRISDELPEEPKSISGLSSLSAAGLTVLVLAATALGSWLYLRQQVPETEKITIAAAPAPIDQRPKTSVEQSTPNQSTAERKTTNDATAKSAETNQSLPLEQHAENGAKPNDPAGSGEHVAPSQTSKLPNEPQPAAAVAPTAASTTASSGTAGAAPLTKEDRFKRMISDLKSHREGRQDQSMSIGEAIDLCEFYPEHLPKVRFQGCLVHSSTLNESSLKQRYGDPDATTELSDGSVNIQGRSFDLATKPTKVLRYDWLEIYVSSPDGEIWAVRRHQEPPAEK